MLSEAELDRFVGEYKYAASGQIVTVRRDGDRLFLKVQGDFPEGPLAPRSKTRFVVPWGSIIEFKLKGKDKSPGATVEQGPYRIPLERL